MALDGDVEGAEALVGFGAVVADGLVGSEVEVVDGDFLVGAQDGFGGHVGSDVQGLGSDLEIDAGGLVHSADGFGDEGGDPGAEVGHGGVFASGFVELPGGLDNVADFEYGLGSVDHGGDAGGLVEILDDVLGGLTALLQSLEDVVAELAHLRALRGCLIARENVVDVFGQLLFGNQGLVLRHGMVTILGLGGRSLLVVKIGFHVFGDFPGELDLGILLFAGGFGEGLFGGTLAGRRQDGFGGQVEAVGGQGEIEVELLVVDEVGFDGVEGGLVGSGPEAASQGGDVAAQFPDSRGGPVFLGARFLCALARLGQAVGGVLGRGDDTGLIHFASGDQGLEEGDPAVGHVVDLSVGDAVVAVFLGELLLFEVDASAQKIGLVAARRADGADVEVEAGDCGICGGLGDPVVGLGVFEGIAAGLIGIDVLLGRMERPFEALHLSIHPVGALRRLLRGERDGRCGQNDE